MRRIRVIGCAVLVLVGLATPLHAASRPASARRAADAVERSRSEVQSAARAYHDSLVKLLALQEADLQRARDDAANFGAFYSRGIVSLRELQEKLARQDAAQARVDATHRELGQAESVVAETSPGERGPAPEQLREEGSGTHPWSLVGDAPKIERFFAARFGHPLPVSAFGQTALHERMGLDHHNALDVAVHPDSPEGRALIDYLRRHGVPFLAFRGPLPGAATGAHVHVGEGSRRIAAKGHVTRAGRRVRFSR